MLLTATASDACTGTSATTRSKPEPPPQRRILNENPPLVIARVRRATRNADMLAICDWAEAAVTSRQPAEPSPSYDAPSYDAAVVRCPVCEARRAADAASARHRRAAKRGVAA